MSESNKNSDQAPVIESNEATAGGLEKITWKNINVKLGELKPWSENPRCSTEQQAKKILESFDEFGQVQVFAVSPDLDVYDGHQRLSALLTIHGENHRVAARMASRHLTEQERKKLVIYLHSGATGSWDWDIISSWNPDDLIEWGMDSNLMLDFRKDATALNLLLEANDKESDSRTRALKTLSDRFIVPPFSVLDTRQGYWQERKHAWIDLGIESELGRGENLRGMPQSNIEYMYNKKEYGAKGKARAFSVDLMKGELTKNQAQRLRSNVKDAPPLPDYVKQGGGAGFPTAAPGTSIFDPVLCELIYRWFACEGYRVLDPFAGGSVRGIVASYLGRHYTGVDLRAEQVEANRKQGEVIGSQYKAGDGQMITRSANPDQENTTEDPEELTPVQEINGIYVKRDDLFAVNGVCGGKVRTCLALAENAKGVVTAGSRQSPQVNIVSRIAKRLKIPCQVHVPSGELSPEVTEAGSFGAEIVQHKPGYNTVIIARARDAASSKGWTEIPFGMECQEAVTQTRRQVANIPPFVKRIVIPVGSGMSLCGLLWGLKDNNLNIPVIGIKVGADPEKRLKEFAPPDYESMVQIIDSPLKYEKPAPNRFGDLLVDPIYEAKCLPFLQEGDLFWIVGRRATVTEVGAGHSTIKASAPGDWISPKWITGDSRNIASLVEGEYDLIFSCPPYGDLEVYSDDPADLSTLPYKEFLIAYRAIISACSKMLKPDRFACFVVSDIRDKRGFYRNLPAETIKAFQDAGLILYNEGILVNVIGSLPILVGRQFTASRKLGRTHQNVLIFYKGDPKAIKSMGDVEVGDIEKADA